MERISLGLGLFYSVTNSNIYYPKQWICKSNIPYLEEKILDVQTQEEAHRKVKQILLSNFQGLIVFLEK